MNPNQAPTTPTPQGPPVSMKALAQGAADFQTQIINQYNNMDVFKNNGISFAPDPTHPGQVMQVNGMNPLQLESAQAQAMTSISGAQSAPYSNLQSLMKNVESLTGKVYSNDQIQSAMSAVQKNPNTDPNTILQQVGQPQTYSQSETSLSTRQDALTSALAALNAAQSILQSSGGAEGPLAGWITKSFLGQWTNPTGHAYESSKIDIATNIAKVITGSSRPSQMVIQQYMDSLPSVTDTPAAAQAKLKALKTMMYAQASAFGLGDIANQFEGATSGQTPTATGSGSNSGWSIVGTQQ